MKFHQFLERIFLMLPPRSTGFFTIPASLHLESLYLAYISSFVASKIITSCSASAFYTLLDSLPLTRMLLLYSKNLQAPLWNTFKLTYKAASTTMHNLYEHGTSICCGIWQLLVLLIPKCAVLKLSDFQGINLNLQGLNLMSKLKSQAKETFFF